MILFIAPNVELRLGVIVTEEHALSVVHGSPGQNSQVGRRIIGAQGKG